MSDPRQSREAREGALTRFSLDRRVTVLVLLATILVVGLVAAVSIPLELFPRGFTASYLAVNVPWQDAPAQEVLDKIVLPLEEELSTVRGLERVNSFATVGFGRVFLSFRQGTDMDVAYREVRDRIERARPRLPEDAEKIFLRKDDVSGIPVAFVGLLVPEGITDAYSLIEKNVVLPLERIDGVASVGIEGLVEKEILIELDRQKTEAAGLNIYRLAQELSNDNFTLASGNVRSGDRKLMLRSVARYRTQEELADRLVAPKVRLGDVATVRYEAPERDFRIRVNSELAVGLNVVKEGEANTLAVSQEIRDTVARLGEDPRLKALEMEVLFDQGEVVMESLDTLMDSGKIGGLFAFAVLFFFLRRVRMTLIIALSIPLSIVIALTVMFFAGESLNILSLLGLMICVGLLVDNSVVVAENIYRLHRDGYERREATIRGTGEIALAVVMATLTTVAVFLPVSLVDGEAQFFLLRLSMPISVSLLGSLLVALVFVPLAVYLTLPATGNGKNPGWLSRVAGKLHTRMDGTLRAVYVATLGRINRVYGRVLAFFLRRRLDLVMVLLAVFALTSWAMQEELVKIVEHDENARNGFQIQISMPESYTFEDTEQWFLDAEKVLEENQEAWDLEGYLFFHRTRGGRMDGWIREERTNELTPRELTEKVVEALPERAGVEIFTGNEGSDTEEKLALHTFTLHGEDAAALERTAEDLRDLFAEVDGVVGARQVEDTGPKELGLVVDRDRAQRQEINPAVIAGVVGYALRGQALPEYWVEGREIPVRVRFEESDRESLAELADFAVPLGQDGSGESVSLASVTDVQFLETASTIRRRDKRMAQTVTLELEEGREEETKDRLRALASQLDLPEGIVWGGGQTATTVDEDVEALGFAAGVSIIFIYFLMAFLFESLVLPLSILFTIPLAFLGVVWVHVFAGRDIDFLGMVGVVLLIGVVVNNGIVLIDYVNRLRREGYGRAEAIERACDRRFRPIMMTALTTIFGMIPLTVGGSSSIGLSYVSFGYTLIGGLTTSTLLTLLVVPVFYTLIEDGRDWVVGAVGRGKVAESAPSMATPPLT